MKLAAVRDHKGFGTGLLYTTCGVAALIIGRSYPVGSAGRMGPGYFPTIVAALLILVGIVALVRSFWAAPAQVGRIAWRGMILVLGSVVLFGLLLERAGLIVASVVLLLTSASGSREFRFEWRAALGLVALVTVCALGFVAGLGIPMPLVGTWFSGSGG